MKLFGKLGGVAAVVLLLGVGAQFTGGRANQSWLQADSPAGAGRPEARASSELHRTAPDGPILRAVQQAPKAKVAAVPETAAAEKPEPAKAVAEAATQADPARSSRIEKRPAKRAARREHARQRLAHRNASREPVQFDLAGRGN